MPKPLRNPPVAPVQTNEIKAPRTQDRRAFSSAEKLSIVARSAGSGRPFLTTNCQPHKTRWHFHISCLNPPKTLARTIAPFSGRLQAEFNIMRREFAFQRPCFCEEYE